MAEYQSQISLLFRDRFSPGIAEAARTLNRSSAVFEEMQRATDRTGGALTEFTRDADRTGGALAELARDAERAGGEVAAMARDAERAGGAVAEFARDADRTGGAVAEIGRDAERAGGDLAQMARDAERAGGAVAEMGRDAERAGRRVEDSASAASGETRRSTGAMSAAWKGLDILDDVGGVLGMIDGLTAGFREMAAQAIAASRETELALARVASLQTEYEGGAGGHLAIRERETLQRQAYLFATGQSDIGELVPVAQAEYVERTKEAMSAGLDLDAAMALTEHSALLAAAAEGTTTEAAEMLRPMYNLMADHEAEPVSEIARLADQVAATQALYDMPALANLTEAVSAAATLSDQMGLPTEVMLAAIGTFHQGKITGSEAGEALKSALEEIVGGMEALGLSVVTNAEGDLDLPATLQVLRETDLGNPVERSEKMKVFGEEGSQAMLLLTGKMYQNFLEGIDNARDSEGRTMERALPLVETRHMRRERLRVTREALRESKADSISWLDSIWLDARQAWVDAGVRAHDRAKGLRQAATTLTPAAVRGEVPAVAPAAAFMLSRLPGLGAGQAISDTLADGVPAGSQALGAATSETLQTGVDDYLPHSDARRGPLSNLTASGRAIPITLAEGVLQEAGQLTAAVTATLALPAAAPLFVDVLTGDLAPPAVPVIPPLFADILTGDLVPPAAPALPPLIAEAFAGDLAPPALPTLMPLFADVLTGDLVPPAAPALPPLIAEAFAGDVIPPALPTLMPLYADVLTGDLVPPAVPAVPPLIAEAFAGDVAPPALPTLMLPPLTIGMLEGAPDVALPAPRGRETGAPAGPTLQPPPALLAALLDVTAELRATHGELRATRGEMRDLRADLRDQRERRAAPAETRVVVEGDLANGDAAAEYLAGLGDGA